jgi:hypothetical protein
LAKLLPMRAEKITLAEMRPSGPRRLLVYCADYRCAHSVTIDAPLAGWRRLRINPPRCAYLPLMIRHASSPMIFGALKASSRLDKASGFPPRRRPPWLSFVLRSPPCRPPSRSPEGMAPMIDLTPLLDAIDGDPRRMVQLVRDIRECENCHAEMHCMGKLPAIGAKPLIKVFRCYGCNRIEAETH